VIESIDETGGVDQAVKGAAALKIVGSPVLTQPRTVIPPAYALTASVAPASGSGRSMSR
jgi:hypothetical protein